MANHVEMEKNDAFDLPEDQEEIRRYFVKLIHLVPTLDDMAIEFKDVDKLLTNDRVIQSIIDYIKDLESKLATASGVCGVDTFHSEEIES